MTNLLVFELVLTYAFFLSRSSEVRILPRAFPSLIKTRKEHPPPAVRRGDWGGVSFGVDQEITNWLLLRATCTQQCHAIRMQDRARFGLGLFVTTSGSAPVSRGTMTTPRLSSSAARSGGVHMSLRLPNKSISAVLALTSAPASTSAEKTSKLIFPLQQALGSD